MLPWKRNGVLLLAPVKAALGGGDHTVRLVVSEFGAVDGLAQQRGILGVGDSGFGTLEFRPRDGAGFHQSPQSFDPSLRASDLRRILCLRKGRACAHKEDNGRKSKHSLLF